MLGAFSKKQILKNSLKHARLPLCALILFCTVFASVRPAYATSIWQPVIHAMQRMAEQLSAVAMHQAFIVGTFLDAKHQLETQRLFQELQIQAHKDYQPSTSFCMLGTAARSLGHSEALGRYNALVLSRRHIARHLGNANMASAEKEVDDKTSRWKKFTEVYCDPRDNNPRPNDSGSGLAAVCKTRNPARNQADRINIDIDYTRMIENRRSIGVSYPMSPVVSGADDADVMALAQNLYGHDVLFRVFSEGDVKEDNKNHLYMALRSVAAKRSVAENSFNAIVGLKSYGSAGGAFGGGVETYKYLGKILMELGIPELEVKEYLGLDPNADWVRNKPDYIPDPSYFAQLEILAKKIYQSQRFYANLYDTPTNVERKAAALTAIELMLDRAIFESQLRQEMALSVLLSTKLQKNFDDANTALGQ